jgi:hypothetical protein
MHSSQYRDATLLTPVTPSLPAVTLAVAAVVAVGPDTAYKKRTTHQVAAGQCPPRKPDC